MPARKTNKKPAKQARKATSNSTKANKTRSKTASKPRVEQTRPGKSENHDLAADQIEAPEEYDPALPHYIQKWESWALELVFGEHRGRQGQAYLKVFDASTIESADAAAARLLRNVREGTGAKYTHLGQRIAYLEAKYQREEAPFARQELDRIVRQLNAPDVDRYFSADMQPNFAALRADWPVWLDFEIKYDSEEGTTETKLKRRTDKALELLARRAGTLEVLRHEHTGEGGGPIAFAISDEQHRRNLEALDALAEPDDFEELEEPAGGTD